MVGMDGREHVAVARNFLLRAVSRFDLLEDESVYPIGRDGNTLDPVGRLRALHDCDAPQRSQHLGKLIRLEILPAPEFPGGAHRHKQPVRKRRIHVIPVFDRSHIFVLPILSRDGYG
jgi:hypothetical protein